MCGWIKLHRDAMRSSLWANVKAWRLFEWCLMSASYDERTVFVGSQPVHLMPGQMVFTLRNASVGTTLSQKEIRGALKVLEMGSQISLQRAARFSLLTIVNWDTYQNIDDNDGSERALKGHSKGSERAHYKEVKKQRNKEDISLPVENQEFDAQDAKQPASPLVDSEASNHSECTIEPQTSIQGQRKKPKEAYPEKITSILDRFAEIRKSDDSRDVASRSIAKRIKEGYTPEELMRCVERYHKTIENPEFPYKVGNFFGQKAYFKGYLDENFTEPEPPKSDGDYQDARYWEIRKDIEAQIGCSMITPGTPDEVYERIFKKPRPQKRKEPDDQRTEPAHTEVCGSIGAAS